ncbi:MAG: c-type cytochrome [Bacteriovoracaceae bacterium]
MESRLVMLLVYLSVAGGVISLVGYKKYYDPNRKERVAAIAKLEHDLATAKPGEVKVEVVNLDAPELAAAKEIYVNKGQCITCHGDKGQGLFEQLAPKLAGQWDWYLATQLKKMKSGERLNDKMMPYLKNLSEADLKEVIKYIVAFPKK